MYLPPELTAFRIPLKNRKDSGGVLAKEAVGVEYCKHDERPASTGRARTTEPVVERRTGGNAP